MKLLIVIILACFLSSNAYASNFRFLKDSVLADFSDTDIAEFKQFVGNALDTLEDHKPVIWNSQSGNVAGKFMVTITYQTGEVTCRRSRFLLKSESTKEPFQFEICKRDGLWQIEATPVKNFNDTDWELLTESIITTLNKGPNGTPFSWSNPATGNFGSQVALSRFTQGQHPCRALAISIFDKHGQSLNGNYTFCKNTQGQWHRLATPANGDLNKTDG